MGECLRAEARGLKPKSRPHVVALTMTKLDVRPQRAHRRLGGARVLARKLRVEPCPTFRRRAPRHGCQPCLRGSRLSSRVPSALSLSVSRLGGTHSRRGQSGLRERVARRRRLRRGGFEYEAKMARPPPCLADRARRGLLAFRGTGGLPRSPGLSSYGWKAAP